MEILISQAKQENLTNSFFLHIAPNLGISEGKEIIKYSVKGDVGTTDIQFMIKGAIKEAGLLVLINKFIGNKYGSYPFGENFNVREAPLSQDALIALCKKKINPKEMPLIIGIGDTVTSNPCQSGSSWLRGGSDRGFLTLIQELGKIFNQNNKVILVDSSGGEVDRPSLNSEDLEGISDREDKLKFNYLVKGGPKEYIDWFTYIANKRSYGNHSKV